MLCFQAEDGRRGFHVTGVQTCALPIAEVVAEVIGWVKGRDLVVDTPIRLDPSSTVGDALALLPKRAHGAVIVVEDDRPVGEIGRAACRERGERWRGDGVGTNRRSPDLE